ncbi:uncharacterized protein LOC125588510 [Brassica napus]|uniref:uncharacterized protein LOC125588510 n=1 Tax=Brassica napus TaxID=3708 RepID=UPI0006AA8448|nr:uncharacterized protein LOC125588510 [Brassica napus]
MTMEEEDEEPFIMPDLPEYYSTARNCLSLVGRLLNPSQQKMSDLIKDMPRKWQLYERVQGIALSKDRFQFIFKYEQDLVDILERGVHSFNQWSLATERWVAKPPPDYLQFIEVWVRMRNIPVNHYTSKALTALGDFAGMVIVVAFDPDKPQTTDYVRVKVRFDLTKPLRRAKEVTLPGGEVVSILYDYERIQKRCYICQRLTHDQDHCPFERKKASQSEDVETSVTQRIALSPAPIIKESDPLFGVIKESQVGVNPATGRRKIADEVLEGMRQYLLTANGPEQMARKERIINSLKDLEHDPLGQKAVLRLEPAPIFTSMLDKGKGVVFDFKDQKKHTEIQDITEQDKLMGGAIRSGRAMSLVGRLESIQSEQMVHEPVALASFSQYSSTGYSIGFFESGTSGTKQRKVKPRRRPGTFKRKLNGKGTIKGPQEEGLQSKNKLTTCAKRKVSSDVETSQNSARCKKPMVVPNEGPSNI